MEAKGEEEEHRREYLRRSRVFVLTSSRCSPGLAIVDAEENMV